MTSNAGKCRTRENIDAYVVNDSASGFRVFWLYSACRCITRGRPQRRLGHRRIEAQRSVRHERNEVKFSKESQEYGGGFVVKGNQITEQMAKCHIKSKEEDDSQIQLSATCSTDIMPPDSQFHLEIIDQNTITCTFPEMKGME
jgi:hypothetical protein